MDSFLDFKNAEAALAQIAEQLAEEKIPVQHATDGVAKVLGAKSAVKFLTHLRPGAEKHTSWNKVNTALTNQGVKTHHIAKIASHIKPAQYKEDVDLGEDKDIVIRDKSGKVTKWSHEGDWRKSDSGTTTDKSGAKHTPYSKARDLARSALKRSITKEETIVEDSGAYEKAEENKRSADSAKKQGDMFAHHLHMADHHDNMSQWHGEKGRHGEADKHAAKAEEHHEKAMTFKESVELDEGKMGQLSADIGSHIDKHVAEYKANGGAEHLMSKIDHTAKKIATQHGLEHKHAHKFVSDYVEKKLNEDVAASEYKVKKFVGPDGETHERKVRPHIVQFKNSKAHGEPLTDKEVKESAPVAPSVGVHRIGVTVSDPHHTMVSQRKEKLQKFVRVTSNDKAKAIEQGKKHFKSKGWKVHDAEHTGMVHEEVELAETDASWAASKEKEKQQRLAPKDQDTLSKIRSMLAKEKKPVKEEADQIDEISQKLAGNYYGAATKQHLNKVGMKPNMYDRIEKDMGKQRKAGVDRALDRVTGARKTNEEADQIDELSNATLQSYKDKAMKSADALAAKGQHSKANDRYMKHMQASGKQISHTMGNIHKAMQQRLQSEDTELEEAMDKDSLRKALSKHEQHAIDANRRGDDEAVKMHQGKMNQIKDKMAKLARSE